MLHPGIYKQITNNALTTELEEIPEAHKVDRLTNGAEAYTYPATTNYVKHDGSKPMNVTWRLDRPIPAKFLKKTNKLVVG